jgi:hypothetical protein
MYSKQPSSAGFEKVALVHADHFRKRKQVNVRIVPENPAGTTRSSDLGFAGAPAAASEKIQIIRVFSRVISFTDALAGYLVVEEGN